MADTIRAIMVNHVALDMAAPPAAVWQAILDDYVDAKKFREAGAVEPSRDPAAILGGYRIRIEHEGIIDERVVRITERDEEARRLSAVADYLSVPGGMRVFATYHAQEVAGGTRYAIDCHAELEVATPADRLAETLRELTSGADRHLLAYLETVRARVEQQA